MIERQQIIDTARTYLGTPFHHQGRLKNVGIDCVGLIICVAHDLNLTDYDYTTYAHQPDGKTMTEILSREMIKINPDEVLPGDVLYFAFDRDPQHVAIVSDIGIIHAYSQVRKCIETSIDQTWKNRIRGAFRYKGIE